MKLVSLFVWKF